MIKGEHVYPSVIQMVGNAESISWNRFWAFIALNTVLILAWTPIYTSTTPPPDAKTVLAIMFGIGIVTSITWAFLGLRGRKFLNVFVELGKQIEDNSTLWATEIQNIKPCTTVIQNRESLPGRWAGSFYVLTVVPILFAILYVVLMWTLFK